jgi:hypothetical protein
VGAGIQVTKSVGGVIIDQIPETETMNKIKSHKNYEDAKNITYSTVKGAANVIGGIFRFPYKAP